MHKQLITTYSYVLKLHDRLGDVVKREEVGWMNGTVIYVVLGISLLWGRIRGKGDLCGGVSVGRLAELLRE